MSTYMKFYCLHIIFASFQIARFQCVLLKKRKFIKYTYIASVSSQLFFNLFNIYLKLSHPILSYVFYQLSFIVTLLVVFDDSLSKKFCTYLLQMFALIFSETFPAFFFLMVNTFIPDMSLLPIDILSSGNIALSLLYCVPVLILIFISFHFLSNLFEHIFALLKIRTLLFLLLSLVVVIMTTNGLFFATNVSNIFLIGFIYWGCFFICVPLFIVGLNDLKKLEEQAAYHENQKKLLKQQLLYYQKTNDSYQEIRKWNHDSLNHLIAISYLLETHNSKKAIEYINLLIAQKKGKD